MIVSLSQAELDDAYHLAYFQCEAAAVAAVRRILVFEDQMATCEILINRITEDMHEAEAAHMGPERYAALMGRLVSRGKEPRA